MQRKLVLVLTSQDLVAGLDNQLILAIPEPPARMIDLGCGLLQRRIGNDHFTRHQVVADTEVLQRALRLGPPQLVGGDLDLAKTVAFGAKLNHVDLREAMPLR
jgi:hypothetical protein